MDNGHADGEEPGFLIDETLAGQRLDKALSTLATELSRSRIKALIEDGQVVINGEVCSRASCAVEEGDEITVTIPPPVAAHPEPENIPLDVVYEDSDVLVLNKPAGIVVHPGAGHYSGTLVNALLHHCGDTLSGIGGVLRPGIVHRLDKDTSGLMMIAKNDRAHQGLSSQLQDRSLSRVYKALVFQVPMPRRSIVDQPLARHHVHRTQMVVNHRYGRQAITHYQVLENFGEAAALVECKLESGRTHQIRVHMQFIKHPVLGDPVYGAQKNAISSALKKAEYGPETIAEVLAFPRQALHAQAIAFIHPVSGEPMEFESELPVDFSKLLKILHK